ncbi:MAG: hypothetical protein IT548_12700 [Alphaproteobacteria bacterium]|nr:hypothetical protein [Alphaproteobacteria bacterium]
MTKPISRALFDLLAIGTRRAMTRIMSTERSWWSNLDGTLLGAVILDHTDNDFGWVILARDTVGRFRCVELNMSMTSERVATAELRLVIAEKERDPLFLGYESQGDEPNDLLDLLQDRGIPDGKLHPYFKILRDEPSKHPARTVLAAISPWLRSFDANLVKEFQESQFDQRLWEVYLWATLRDQGYDVEHHEAPDLVVSSPLVKFSIEATTVAPSKSGPLATHPEPSTPHEFLEFLANYMPMKFGSPLVSKLNKVDAAGRHYWQKPGLEGIPFVIAIADFHQPANTEEHKLGSMTYSQNGLYAYLYGTRVSVEKQGDQIVLKNTPVTEHTYNGKTVPSGFFDLPDAENISAVVFTNAATLSKFDRVGVMAGFCPPDHKYIRVGHRFDPAPEALEGIPFSSDVSDPTYEEYWGDELQVFHNPKAVRPLPPEAFPDAAHFFYEDGQLTSIDQGGRVLGSFTMALKILSDRERQAVPS